LPLEVEQLVLDLPHRESWDEADFFITPHNEAAVRLLQAWPDWQAPAAVIFGPPKCGKTYLAKLWQKRSQGEFVPLSELREHSWAPPYSALVIEDIGSEPFCETALFHHLNLAREHATSILLTACTPPGQWSISLPDLRSRVRSYPTAEITQPDEEHLAALLLKHFTDRQIEVTPEVITFLASRMERTMAAAQQLTAALDQLALSERRRITKPFASKVLKRLRGWQDDAEEEEGES
jgi:chromosomal replication initiation ATPase DnaA